ncbi:MULTISPECIES: hypothetical protein [unclassified Fusibacter]|uniref:hypothetical protein n=1 Tax=unclassified Fusibacter TaxID=2624464 RepID=UPI0010105219|nr:MULTISPECIES: hypothetical protein [unclassified Fusibacter]MCK8061714.1 hypothetical protein [Fusibacter sp. A2]NPE23899.1 hypothetical protein [Fusibacter sp. A1]RXV58462.1 hypothetical protein DWB64_19120 [Fusibacter sp. A1]
MFFILYALLLIIIAIYQRTIDLTSNTRSILLIYHFIVLFIFNFVGSFYINNPSGSIELIQLILITIYSTFKCMLFIPEFLKVSEAFHFWGNYQVVSVGIWAIFIINFFITAQFIIFNLLGFQMNQFISGIKSYIKNKVVFVIGDLDNVLDLLEDIKKNNHKTTLVYFTNRDIIEKKILTRNIHFKPLSDFEKWFKKINRKKRKQIDGLLLHEDEVDNIGFLGVIENCCQLELLSAKKIRLTFLCSSSHLRHQDWKTKLNVYFISKPQLAISSYLNSNSILNNLVSLGRFESNKEDSAFINKDISLCFIGFNEISQELLLQTFETTRFLKSDYSENLFNADVFDKKANYSFFSMQNRSVERAARITYYNCMLEDYDYIEQVESKLSEYDQIFVNLDVDEDSFRTALLLVRIIEANEYDNKPYVCTFIKDSDKIELFTRKEIYTKYSNLSLINLNKQILIYDNFINRNIENIARRYHVSYNEIKHKDSVEVPYESFDELTHFIKLSNLALAKDEKNKLFILSKFENSTEKEEIINYLAIYEHYRWCAFLSTHGWSTLPQSDRTSFEIIEGSTKRVLQKKHLCLIEWDKLNEINMFTLKNEFQSYNIEQSENWYKKNTLEKL